MSTEAAETYRLVTFKIEPSAHAQLERLAKEHERTVSAELRLAVRAYLRDEAQA